MTIELARVRKDKRDLETKIREGRGKEREKESKKVLQKRRAK